MRNTWQFVSLVTQRLFRVSTRKSNCSMINASHSPFLPHMLPRMVFFHPGIYNIVNAVWLKGRSRNAQRQMGTEECRVEAVYEMEMIIGSAISNLCICLSMTPQVRTHSYCSSVICYCKRIWSKTLQITLPWKHLSISGKQKRAPPHVDVTPVKTTARNCPTPTFYWVFFLSELRVHKHDSHLQWKYSFNSNTAIFFSHLVSVRPISIISLVPKSCFLCKQAEFSPLLSTNPWQYPNQRGYKREDGRIWFFRTDAPNWFSRHSESISSGLTFHEGLAQQVHGKSWSNDGIVDTSEGAFLNWQKLRCTKEPTTSPLKIQT